MGHCLRASLKAGGGMPCLENRTSQNSCYFDAEGEKSLQRSVADSVLGDFSLIARNDTQLFRLLTLSHLPAVPPVRLADIAFPEAAHFLAAFGLGPPSS